MIYNDQIMEIIQKQNGMVFSKNLSEKGIPRIYLTNLVKAGKLERVSRGVYVDVNMIEDELYFMQVKYTKLIYSHETALYFHGLTDRTPFEYSVTVPSGYKAPSNVSESLRLYYVKKVVHEQDVIVLKTSFGNEVRLYSIERTICDIVRSRNRMDSQIVNEALKRLPDLKGIDYAKMMEIARSMRLEKIIRGYLEVLL